MTPLLEAHQLERSFGVFTAVNSVSFSVGAGEVVGLLGANGAGKTTTIRMLVGLLQPTTGTSKLLGETPNRKVRRRLGYVAQGLGLYRDLTVQQNVEFTAAAFDAKPVKLDGDLADAASRLVGDMSLGLQRQLAFVCAIQHMPEVLVLDEPTSGVEPLAAARLWDQVRNQAERGVGTLVSTHSMQEARQCDRLLLMAAGQVVAEGSEDDIVRDTIAVRVDTDDGPDTWGAAFDALGNAGILVTLDGTSVRAVDTTVKRVHDVLNHAGIRARVHAAPATLEEKMASLSLLAAAST
jgi:ABC-2 type transport system ATP-binding protein/ribosome-dependent ATPase